MKSISLIFCTTFLLLLGCSSGSTPNENSQIPDQTNTTSPVQANLEQDNSQIEGFWDVTLVNDDNTIDERYLLIPAFGTEFTLFDYEGDLFGTGENCHTTYPVLITHVENTEYIDSQNRPVSFNSADGTTLIQVNVDVEDQDNDGDTTDSYTQHWPLVDEGVSLSDYSTCRS